MEIKQEIKYGILCGIMLISILFQISCSGNKNDLNIEVSTTGCYRSCPIVDIKILDNKVFFNLINFNDKNGFYKYELTEKERENLEKMFFELEFENLQDEYTSNRVDMQAYSVYLAKNSQEKMIYYYEGEAPEKLENLVQKIIQLKNRNLVATKEDFNSKTRDEVPLLNIPIPPLPDED